MKGIYGVHISEYYPSRQHSYSYHYHRVRHTSDSGRGSCPVAPPELTFGPMKTYTALSVSRDDDTGADRDSRQ